LQEVASIREYYARFGEGIPKAMIEQLDALERRLLDYEEEINLRKRFEGRMEGLVCN
jgi:hypothetical protein